MDSLLLARILTVIAVLIGGYALFLRRYALQLERNNKRLSSLVTKLAPKVTVVRTKPVVSTNSNNVWIITTHPVPAHAKFLQIDINRAEFTLERDTATEFTSGEDAEAVLLSLGYAIWSHVYKDNFK